MLEITEHDRKYWRYEYNVVSRYLIPLLKSWKINFAGSILLDVGCGDGGGISAFYDAGFICKGFDIESRRVELANRLRGDRKFEIIEGDIYSDTFPYSNSKFDLIVLHDVFEHLEDKEQVLNKLSLCLNDSGKILITFPPYYSAFGAHQQLMSSKIGKIPFLHLAPFAMSYLIKRLSDTRNPLVAEIKKLIKLKMGIGKFESIVGKSGLKICSKKKYIIGPNHSRFGLIPLGAGIFGEIPIIKELISSGVIYLLTTKDQLS